MAKNEIQKKISDVRASNTVEFKFGDEEMEMFQSYWIGSFMVIPAVLLFFIVLADEGLSLGSLFGGIAGGAIFGIIGGIAGFATYYLLASHVYRNHMSKKIEMRQRHDLETKTRPLARALKHLDGLPKLT